MLSVVIPCHNRADLLRLCLASVAAHAPPSTEIIVVDDASPGAAASRAAAEFAGLRVLRLPKRRGFCVAANRGIEAARAPVVELLNDDTQVTPGWAEAALAAFADPSVGAVAPLVLIGPGEEREIRRQGDEETRRQGDKETDKQRSVSLSPCLPVSLSDSAPPRIDSAGDEYDPGGFARKRGHGRPLGEEFLTGGPVFGASASSAFYRREALLRVGGFPEEFGAYFEDVDLSFRLHRGGYRILYEPRSRVWHRGSSSYGKKRRRLVEQQSCNEERVFWRNVPGPLLRVLPRHLAVLLGKALRRWREGNFLPFCMGRLRALGELPQLLGRRAGNPCGNPKPEISNPKQAPSTKPQ